MFYVNGSSAARALNIVKVEKVALVANHVALRVLKHRVALVANDLPRADLLMIVLNNFHIS